MSESFQSLGIEGPWLERLAERGIDRPAPIQEAAIPVLLRGGDAVIRSQTGTGKTLAYLLPVLEKLDGESKRIQAVVLAPTAELAMQIAKEAADLTANTLIRVQALIGSASAKRQIEKLKQHPQLVVGTPGRIWELMKMKKLKTAETQLLVIDEADQTFSLGEDGGDTENILAALKGRKQTVFCSATMSAAAKTIVERWSKEAQWIEVLPEGEAGASPLPAAVEHILLVTEERKKIDLVRRLIRNTEPRAAILFVNETEKIAETEAKLRYHKLDVEAIYGNQPKQERASVMQRFRNGSLKLLLATDVAARGLDAPDVTHVIHIDPPIDAEHYLHRAGRTGRMGRSGMSVLLLAPNRKFIAEKFEKQLGIKFRHMTLREGELQPVEAVEPKDKPAAPRVKPPRSPGKPAVPQPKKAVKKKRDQKTKGAPRWLKAKWAENASGGTGNSGGSSASKP